MGISAGSGVASWLIPPAGFNWDFAQLPFSVNRVSRGVISYTANPYALIPSSVWSAALSQIYHVDPVNGSDSHSGIGTFRGDFNAATALKTLAHAVGLANLSGNASQILIKADTTPIFNRGAAGPATPTTVPIGIYSINGRAVIRAFDAHTWAVDGTFTSTYSVTETNCSSCYDLLNARTVGGKTLYAELALAASPTACNATPGTFCNSGGKTYVNRADGAAVTDLNTAALRAGPAFAIGAATAYLIGFDFEGGLTATVAGTRNLVCESCTFRYAQQYNGGNGIAVDKMTGVAVLLSCQADANGADGLNFHGTSGQAYVMTIGCSGYDNGRGTNVSDNGHTGHETVVGVDINGDYRYNHGGTVAWINTSQVWCIGTVSKYDNGDAAMGGNSGASEFNARDTATMWLDDTTAEAASSSNYAILAATGTTIYKRNHLTVVGRETGNIVAQ